MNDRELTQAVNDLTVQLRDFIGDKKAIVGISGGIDSALTAFLCERAVGKENVYGVLMPYYNQETVDSEKVINWLGINREYQNIGEIVNSFNLTNTTDLRLGNIKARTRMTLLYDYAAALDGFVIGTGNKTELEIGYCTKYGDAGVDLEPIGDLYKTEVQRIGKLYNFPKSVLEKAPSAELWSGQTDEQELGMTYREIDGVLKGETTERRVYGKVYKMQQASEHKRNPPKVLTVNRGAN